MNFRRPLAALLMLAGPAAAQTGAAPAPGLAPAPMPDPLMAPSLQTQAARPSLSTLVQQSTWQDPVIAAARAQFKQLPDACAAASFKPTGTLTVFVPPKFDAQGTLLQGIWNERIDVSGCGAVRALNVLTVLQPGQPPVRVPTLPGSTHADPLTQKSAVQYAQAVAIRAAAPGCQSLAFVNTRFDGYTGLPNPEIKDRDGRAWREVWTLFACGVTSELTLTFTPNAQGTQLIATNPVKRS